MNRITAITGGRLIDGTGAPAIADGLVVIDFLTRTVQASESLLPDGQSDGRALVPVPVQPQESLAAELTQFLDGIRAGKPEAVGVTVQAALPVLSLVWAIQQQLYGA